MKACKPLAAALAPAEPPISSLAPQPMQMNISHSAITRVLVLKRGLYLIDVTPAATLLPGTDKPFIRVSVPPCVGGETNNVVLGIIGSTKQIMTASGGVAVADVRSRGGTLVISGHG